ncbi:CAP domain-containing protein [Streptomyces lancefieldiae]|uniref:CAP domain-containing protein n=1 Tax=Streptomyces lancefieldiae TaxID=3075520 RepID=A0ABU3ANX9_9ACTN|nr:CAP domain-containing protein [Streptomyces sp. DSM 40712]MDT0611901.1 CAP domain-containing protein [Streptomyces sp. DSM 40712]
MSELVPGGNVPLPGGPVRVRVPGGFDVSALITDDGGKVGGDDDFVFYNQPDAPGARLRGDTLTVDPSRLRPGAARVTVAVSPSDPGTTLGALPSPTLHVTDAGGRGLARFTPTRPRQETVLLLAELYRRGAGWKLRALGQGYADGLAGLARDFGVEVVDDTSAPDPAPPTAPKAEADGFLALVNAARTAAGSRPVSADPRLVSAARAHAAAMAAAGTLSVETRDGVSVHQRVVSAGYAYLTVGEHLVSGPRTPTEFVAYCLRAERTRRTLHHTAYTHAGWAHVTGGPSGDTYWTALWAVPLTADGLDRTTSEVVDLTNRERSRAGLPALGVDARLTRAAQAHSADMVARDFYSHTDPDGGKPRDRAAAAGATRRTVGENIACGQRSPADVVEGWMNSPGHRANILKADFTHIGVGLAGGGRAGTYWTQLFGG